MTWTVPAAKLSAEQDALTFDQRVVILERLHQLSELEDTGVDHVATVGLTTLAAYRIGLRAAVRDALARLSDGTYGDCETCRRPISAARLVAVPYARRCASCQQREEESWDQVRRLIGGVVRTLVGEPQGRPQPTPNLASTTVTDPLGAGAGAAPVVEDPGLRHPACALAA